MIVLAVMNPFRRQPPSIASAGGLRRLLRGIVWLAFVSRILVPAGYMPSALADGLPFELCDTRVVALLAGHADEIRGGHHHAAEADETVTAHAHWERCTFGSLSTPAAPGFDRPLILPVAAAPTPAPDRPVMAERRAVVAFRSRAPPALSS